MLARRFLWLVVIAVMLVLAGALAYRLLGPRIMRAALVPSVAFEESPKPAPASYVEPTSWLARPGLPADPTRWTPPGYRPAPHPAAAVFYVPPTTYLKRDRWNAPLDDPDANRLLELFARSQASVFNGVGEVWAPRYRQATFGAFLTSERDAQLALDFAYGDVRRAFDAFVAEVPPDRPLILAGHSQGAHHLMRLLADRVAGKPLATRVVAAYLGGWPVSVTADLPALGLPACGEPGASGCLLVWQSFAEPADPSAVTDVFDATQGLTGAPRAGTDMVCVNPLLGRATREPAPAESNLGSLVPNATLTDATLAPRRVGARCDERGFLLIGPDPVGYGLYILPGNNYHVYDYALFWANLRADAEARLNGWLAQRAASVAADAGRAAASPR